MLITYAACFWTAYILFSLVFFLCAGYVYRVNSKRNDDDPGKRDYPFSAVTLTVIWPILLVGMVVYFIVRALLYGIFLVLFTVALFVIRKPFLIIWLMKAVNWTGLKLLKANTFLVRLIFPQPKPVSA